MNGAPVVSFEQLVLRDDDEDEDEWCTHGAPVVSFEQLVLRDDDDDDDEDDWRDVMQLRKKTVMSCAGQVHDHIAVFGPR